MYPKISPADRERWQRERLLVFPRAFEGERLANLLHAVAEVESWPELAGKWMKYFEPGPSGQRQLCRAENLLDYSEVLREELSGLEILTLLHDLCGEDYVLYKEKINFKFPGGGGFTAHQDAPAFNTLGPTYHITAMIALDDCTLTNGCLEFADAVPEGEILPQHRSGTLSPVIEAGLTWRPVPVPAGSVVLFDSYLPHRSSANRTTRSRRVVLATYNRAAAGSFRGRYFAEKRKAFPPDIERDPSVPFETTDSPYNLGNPIR